MNHQKGGVGKTTTTVALAEAAAATGRPVLVVDTDPQAAATRWLGVAPDADAPGLLDAFTGRATLAELCRPTTLGGVEVVPASAALVAAERTLAREVGAELALVELLRELPDRPPLVLVDTAPTFGVLTVAALAAATLVIIPVECRGPALLGLVPMLEAVEAVRRRLNKRLAPPRVLPVRLDGRTRHSGEVLDALRERYDGAVTATAVRENVTASIAATEGTPPARYAAHSAVVEDYAALARELLGDAEWSRHRDNLSR